MKLKAGMFSALFVATASIASAQQASFDSAVSDWLGGDDETSLQALATEASNGNTSAQLLLGQIDRDTVPGGFSDFVLSLSDDQRDALLRSPSEEGTKNWLLALSDAQLKELGEIVFGYRATLDPLPVAIALQQNGEKQSAEYVLWNIFNNGRFDVANSIPAENYGLSETEFMSWMKAYLAGDNKAMTMSRFMKDQDPAKVKGLLIVKRLARLLNLEQNISDDVNDFITVVSGNGFDLPEDVNLVVLQQNLSTVAEIDAPLNIVKRLCERCEGDQVDYDCMIQTLEIITGYKKLLALRTPVERVVSPDDYFQSDRPVVTLIQLLKSSAQYYQRPIRSECVAEHLGRSVD